MRGKGIIAVAALCAASFTPSTGAQTPPPVEAFAFLPAISNLRISPDGSKFAALMPVDGELAVFTFDMTNAMKPIGGSRMPEGLRARDIAWANDERVLVTVSYKSRDVRLGENDAFRLVSIAADGSDPHLIMEEKIAKLRARGFDALDAAHIYNMLPNDPDWIVMSFNGDVFKAHVEVDREVMLEENRGWRVGKITRYLTDRDGDVRVRLDQDDDFNFRYRFRRKGDRKWRDVPALSGDAFDEGRAEFLAFAEEPNLIYLRGPADGGRSALFTLDLATGARKLVYAHPTRDVLDIVQDPEGRLRAVTHVGSDSVNEIKYFDESLKQEYVALSNTLQGDHLSYVNQTHDRRWAAVRSSGPSTPPEYHLYDREDHRIIKVGDSYPDVRAHHLGPRTAFRYDARDGLSIEAFLTLPAGATEDDGPFPLIVMPHGGPQARDNRDFDYWAHTLASRGFAVVQPNFRGSTGYGLEFVNAGRGEWGGKMQDDLADAALHLVDEGIADRERIGIMGWSYGGYAAGMGMAKHADLYKAGAMGAGVYDLPQILSTERKTGGDAYWKRQFGTTDGDALKRISPQEHVDAIRGPILVVHGKEDVIVRFDQSKDFAKRAKKAGVDVETLWFDDGDHNLSSEKNRVAWLKATAAFFEEHLMAAQVANAGH